MGFGKNVTLAGILCAALAGGCSDAGGSGGGGYGGGSSYATEEQGDRKLEDTIEQYRQDGEILDCDFNDKYDLGGNEIFYDAWVLLGSDEVVIWYQGENDGEHTAEKAILDLYGIRWIQIEPCPEADIPGILDEIKDVYDWETGVYYNE